MMSPCACVMTGTFDDAHVPDSIEDIPPFIKAFKKRLVRRGIDSRMHILCEYGGRFDRPHTHNVFFNEDFRDMPWRSLGGTRYESDFLNEVWGYGLIHLDAVSPAACRYVAGHNAGKLGIDRFQPDGSRSFFFIPATRPAIGMPFARQFSRDLIMLNASLVGAAKTGVPRTYLRAEPELFASIVEHKRQYAIEHADDVEVPVTTAQSERLDGMARYLVCQMKEVQAWHKGAHRHR